MDERRSYIRALVQTAVSGAEHQRHTIEARIQTVIRNRVEQALKTAEALWEARPANADNQDLQEIIRETLRPMRFNKGRGYYFIFDVNTGTCILHPMLPALEGADVKSIIDHDGRPIVPHMITLIKTKGQGYYQYSWEHPNRPENNHPKLSYVDVFEPLGWAIGSGDYIDDMTADIQHEVLDQLRAISFGANGYIFAANWNGVGLLGPAAGTNIWTVTDPSGRKVVQELAAAARNGGGFVTYRTPPVDGQSDNVLKLSYVSGIPEWQWYIGAGVSINDIQTEITHIRAATRADALQALALGACLVVVLAAVSYLIALHIAGQVGAEINQLEVFLAHDGRTPSLFRPDTLRHAELARLGEAIQAMVRRRDETEDTLARQTRRLEQSNADLERFAYVASHDLREPLRTIASYVGLLRRRYYGRLDHDADTFIDYASEGAQRMHAMIGDLLEYARVKRTTNPFAPVPLDTVLDQALSTLDVSLKDSGADIIVKRPLPVVCGQETLLASLLQNLIDNAIKYRHPDRPPKVTISSQVTATWCTLSVEDNGLGIDPAYRDRIFQIFQRLHPSGAYPGTGVGLSICQSIVHSHGGQLWVETPPNGQGSVFRVLLPLTSASADPPSLHA